MSGEAVLCLNCDCKSHDCMCGCAGIGECVVCGFEAADWKCKKCGGWVCGECIIVSSDGYNICFKCYLEALTRDGG